MSNLSSIAAISRNIADLRLSHASNNEIIEELENRIHELKLHNVELEHYIKENEEAMLVLKAVDVAKGGNNEQPA